ncbi:hypothetical protein C8C76_10567 [Halanaerobium saccharolyticum]|jgi:hypothetical protein|uniref:Uncharacterized protein n=1 Tax=Halanaerobium saccharolyticum TaxID=43595 RepID=A0A2T5RNS3_9FIRM|nr:hypothetical protein [Halanaerobium saccharolyticum]PTW01289.1 hypothetical protein C8C76_10567 [Halanaerobium saccharolyticum]
MNKENEEKIIKAEAEMIRELRKRIYGKSDAGPDYPYSEQSCIFCGAESELKEYKNSYICRKCLADIKN